MRHFRAQRRLPAWIAVLAVLLASLAPTVSHALGWGASLTEVCTAQGSQWVQDGAGPSKNAPGAAHLLGHCPYCSLHAQALGMPPVAGAPSLPAALAGERPSALPQAPGTPHAWVSARPRAPPLSS